MPKQSLRAPLRDGTELVVDPLMSPLTARRSRTFYRALPEEDRLFLRNDVTRPEWLERFMQQDDFRRRGARWWPMDEGQTGRRGSALPLPPRLDGARGGDPGRRGATSSSAKGWARPSPRSSSGSRSASGIEKMVVRGRGQPGRRAKRAFEKLGFQNEAVLKGHVKDIHGVRVTWWSCRTTSLTSGTRWRSWCRTTRHRRD